MNVEELVSRSGAWLGTGADAVVSSRIRLARNIEGTAFPGWAGEEECVRLDQMLRPVLTQIPELQAPVVWSMADLNPIQKEVLRERHLISNELAAKGRGSALIMRPDETLSVMVNEEDHLRIQAMRPGLELAALWKEIDRLDSAIECSVRYAFTPRLGYLTACPSNVGTGLRASAMLHLPGLRLTKEIDPIVKGLHKIGLAVRGLLGEGTDAMGNMFQISNQMTLGETEVAIIHRLCEVVAEVLTHERNARLRLMEKHEASVRDFVGRAHGIITHAHLLTSRETLDLLSGLRLGLDLGMIRNLDLPLIHQLMLTTQPGHMVKMIQRELAPEERDHLRAMIVREKIRAAGVEIAG